jgi:hypothetical protein
MRNIIAADAARILKQDAKQTSKKTNHKYIKWNLNSVTTIRLFRCKVTSMLKACLSSEIKPHLRLVQLDNYLKFNNKYISKFYYFKHQK